MFRRAVVERYKCRWISQWTTHVWVHTKRFPGHVLACGSRYLKDQTPALNFMSES